MAAPVLDREAGNRALFGRLVAQLGAELVVGQGPARRARPDPRSRVARLRGVGAVACPRYRNPEPGRERESYLRDLCWFNLKVTDPAV